MIFQPHFTGRAPKKRRVITGSKFTQKIIQRFVQQTVHSSQLIPVLFMALSDPASSLSNSADAAKSIDAIGAFYEVLLLLAAGIGVSCLPPSNSNFVPIS